MGKKPNKHRARTNIAKLRSCFNGKAVRGKKKAFIAHRAVFAPRTAFIAVAAVAMFGYLAVSFSKAATSPIPACNAKQVCDAPAGASVRELIMYWSGIYGQDAGKMLRIAECESHFDPNAGRGKSHFGVFQFLPSTYAANHQAAGAGPDYWDANNNVRTAIYMLSNGQAGQWECKG